MLGHFKRAPQKNSMFCTDRLVITGVLNLGRLGPMVFDDRLASSEPGENLDRGDIDDGVGMG